MKKLSLITVFLVGIGGFLIDAATDTAGKVKSESQTDQQEQEYEGLDGLDPELIELINQVQSNPGNNSNPQSSNVHDAVNQIKTEEPSEFKQIVQKVQDFFVFLLIGIKDEIDGRFS